MATPHKVRIEGIDATFGIEADTPEQIEAAVDELQAKYAGKSKGQIAQSMWAEAGVTPRGKKNDIPTGAVVDTTPTTFEKVAGELGSVARGAGIGPAVNGAVQAVTSYSPVAPFIPQALTNFVERKVPGMGQAVREGQADQVERISRIAGPLSQGQVGAAIKAGLEGNLADVGNLIQRLISQPAQAAARAAQEATARTVVQTPDGLDEQLAASRFMRPAPQPMWNGESNPAAAGPPGIPTQGWPGTESPYIRTLSEGVEGARPEKKEGVGTYPYVALKALAIAAEDIAADPGNIAMGMGALTKIPGLAKIAHTYFQAEGGKMLWDSIEQFKNAKTPDERAQAWGSVLGGLTMLKPTLQKAVGAAYDVSTMGSVVDGGRPRPQMPFGKKTTPLPDAWATGMKEFGPPKPANRSAVPGADGVFPEEAASGFRNPLEGVVAVEGKTGRATQRTRGQEIPLPNAVEQNLIDSSNAALQRLHPKGRIEKKDDWTYELVLPDGQRIPQNFAGAINVTPEAIWASDRANTVDWVARRTGGRIKLDPKAPWDAVKDIVTKVYSEGSLAGSFLKTKGGADVTLAVGQATPDTVKHEVGGHFAEESGLVPKGRLEAWYEKYAPGLESATDRSEFWAGLVETLPEARTKMGKAVEDFGTRFFTNPDNAKRTLGQLFPDLYGEGTAGARYGKLPYAAAGLPLEVLRGKHSPKGATPGQEMALPKSPEQMQREAAATAERMARRPGRELTREEVAALGEPKAEAPVEAPVAEAPRDRSIPVDDLINATTAREVEGETVRREADQATRQKTVDQKARIDEIIEDPTAMGHALLSGELDSLTPEAQAYLAKRRHESRNQKVYEEGDRPDPQREARYMYPENDLPNPLKPSRDIEGPWGEGQYGNTPVGPGGKVYRRDRLPNPQMPKEAKGETGELTEQPASVTPPPPPAAPKKGGQVKGRTAPQDSTFLDSPDLVAMRERHAKPHNVVASKTDPNNTSVQPASKTPGEGFRVVSTHPDYKTAAAALDAHRRATPTTPAATPEPASTSNPAPSMALFEHKGQTGEAYTAEGERVGVQWALVDAFKELIASHTIDLEANPLFMKILQPRNRTKMASDDQINDIKNKLRPAELGDNYHASTGAPIVGPDLLVESGNGRVIALQRAYREGLAEKYALWLEEHAAEFGLTAEQVGALEAPVLVRVRTTPTADRAKLVEDFNVTPVAQMSAAEVAAVDVRRLTPEMLARFQPSETGNPILAARNADFVRDFFKALPETERGRFITADGMISQDGVRRIQNALMAKAYGDSPILERLAEATDDNVKIISNGLLAAAPEMAALKASIAKGDTLPVDPVPAIIEAAEKLSWLRDQGTKVQDFLDQGDLIGEGISPTAREILAAFGEFGKSGKKTGIFLKSLADVILEEASAKQTSIFGDVETPEVGPLVRAARRMALDRLEGNAPLFGGGGDTRSGEGKTPPEGRGAPPDKLKYSQRPLRPPLEGEPWTFEPAKEHKTVEEGRIRQWYLDDTKNAGVPRDRTPAGTNRLGEFVKKLPGGVRILGIYDRGRLVMAMSLNAKGHPQWLSGEPHDWHPSKSPFWGIDAFGNHLALRDPASPYMRLQALAAKEGIARRPDDRLTAKGSRAVNDRLIPLPWIVDAIRAHEADPAALAKLTGLDVEAVANGIAELKGRHYHSAYSLPLLESVYEIARTDYAAAHGIRYTSKAPADSRGVWEASARGRDGVVQGTPAAAADNAPLGGAERGPVGEAAKEVASPKYSQRPLAAPVYYSKLRREVEAGQGKWKPDDLLRFLKAKGVKAEEMEWSRLEELLEGKASVTKAEVLEHLAENAVEVTETLLGRNPVEDRLVAEGEAAQDAVYKLMGQVEKAVRAKGLVGKDTPYWGNEPRFDKLAEENGLEDLVAEKDAAWERVARSGEKIKALPHGGNPKFGGGRNLVLPGGDQYRELLLTMPPEPSATSAKRDARIKELSRETGERAESDPKVKDLRERIEAQTKIVRDYQRETSARDNAATRRELLEKELQDRYDDINGDLYAEGKRLADEMSAVSQKGYESGHFSEKNILAHVRFNERKGPNGERVLHIEEVQSDWHQAGREKGYASGALPDRYTVIDQSGHLRGDWATRAEAEAYLADAPDFIDRAKSHVAKVPDELVVDERVPDAPFKKTWPDLALKRMVRWAADEGFDRITWTTGEQQASRYDLAKQVDRISYTKRADGTYNIGAERGGHTILAEDHVSIGRVADIVGKDIAKKVEAGEGNVYDRHNGGFTAELTGLDLKVGGEGMKGFYDQMLPAKMGEIARKLDPEMKVGEGTIDVGIKGNNSMSVAATPEVREALKRNDDLGFDSRAEALAAIRDHADFAERWSVDPADVPVLEAWRRSRTGAPVHSIDLTPKAREATQAGFPMFSQRALRSVKEMVADADRHSEWKDWYVRHKSVIDGIYEEDAPVFRRLLAATSQAASVGSNVGLAVKAYEQLRSGKPFTGYLPAVIKNLERIRADEALEGPKVSAYEQAGSHKAGAAQGAPVDRHIAQYLFGTDKPNGEQIAKAGRMMGKAADRLGWDPRQVQASIWAMRVLKWAEDRGRKPEVKSYADFLESKREAIREFRDSLRAADAGGERGGVSAGGGDAAGTGERLSQRSLVRTKEELAREHAWVKDAEKWRGKPGPEGVPYVAANVGDTPFAREHLDSVEKARRANGVPRTKADADVKAEAEAILRDDPRGDKLLVSVARGGKVRGFSDAENVAFEKVLNDRYRAAKKSGKDSDIDEANLLAATYKSGRTELGRALRQGRDLFDSPADRMTAWLERAVFEPMNDKVAKGILEGDPKAIAKQREHVKGVLEAMKKAGADISNITDAQAQDPVFVAQTMRGVLARKAGLNDKIYEYWCNALLSGAQTHAVNTASNAISLAWEYGPQRLVQAAVANIVRGDNVESQSLWHAYGALKGGIAWAEAKRNAAQAWETEATVLEQKTRGDMFAKGGKDFPHVAIEGQLGRGVRVPYRFLKAADEFAKGLVGQMEAAASAYKIARAEGLKGEELGARMTSLISDYGSKAWSDAVSHAELLTFQRRMGAVGQSVMHLRNAEIGMSGIAPGKYILPFVTTPFNIFKTAIAKSPLGVFSAAAKIYRAMKGEPSVREAIRKGTPEAEAATRAFTEQILAWTTVVALSSILNNDTPDDGIVITGPLSFKVDERGEREAQYRSLPPSSIVWKGANGETKVINYSRIEPFATVLGGVADAARILRQGESTDATSKLTEAFRRLTGQFRDKTFLKGIGDIIDAVEDPDKLTRWLSNFGASWVPNLVKQPLRSADEKIRETRVWGASKPGQGGETRTHRLERRTAYSFAPIDRFAPPPRRDIIGQEATKLGGGGGLAFLMRAASPVQIGTLNRNTPKEMIRFDHRMLELQAKDPDAKYFPRQPDPKLVVDGKTVYMSDAQREQYERVAGEKLWEKLKDAPYFTSAEPLTPEDVDRYRDDVKKARAAARAELKMELREAEE